MVLGAGIVAKIVFHLSSSGAILDISLDIHLPKQR